MQQLVKNTKISRVITVTAGAAGTSDINSSSVDMQGFETCVFVLQAGAITSTAVTSIKVQQSSDDGGSDAFSDLEGTAQTIADDDDEEVFYVEVTNPLKRYIRLVVDRGTANMVCSAIAIQTGPRVAPTSHGTGVNGESHISPVEGTA